MNKSVEFESGILNLSNYLSQQKSQNRIEQKIYNRNLKQRKTKEDIALRLGMSNGGDIHHKPFNAGSGKNSIFDHKLLMPVAPQKSSSKRVTQRPPSKSAWFPCDTIPRTFNDESPILEPSQVLARLNFHHIPWKQGQASRPQSVIQTQPFQRILNVDSNILRLDRTNEKEFIRALGDGRRKHAKDFIRLDMIKPIKPVSAIGREFPAAMVVRANNDKYSKQYAFLGGEFYLV